MPKKSFHASRILIFVIINTSLVPLDPDRAPRKHLLFIMKYHQIKRGVQILVTVAGINLIGCGDDNRSLFSTSQDSKVATKPSYEGERLNGIPHGKGIFTFPNGARYEGQVINGKPNGFGINLFANGDRYEGEYLNGKSHGQGKNRHKERKFVRGNMEGRNDGGDGKHIGMLMEENTKGTFILAKSKDREL